MKRLTEQLAESDDRPEITPLIDVIFMLLLFFIVTTTFAEDTFFPIELPTGRNTTVRTAADAVTIEISREGEFALAGEFLPAQSQLFEALRTAQRAGQFSTVIVKTDEQADARHVVAVLDMLRELDIEEFAVAATGQP